MTLGWFGFVLVWVLVGQLVGKILASERGSKHLSESRVDIS